MPEETLLAFADHGSVATEVTAGPEMLAGTLVAGVNSINEELIARFAREGVDIDKLGRLLQEQGVTSFAAAWQSLLSRIKETVGRP